MSDPRVGVPLSSQCVVPGCPSTRQSRDGHCGRHRDQLARKGAIVPDAAPRSRPVSPKRPIDAWLAEARVVAVTETLEPEQRAAFVTLARDYAAACDALVGIRFVNAPVLAEMIRRGWRKIP